MFNKTADDLAMYSKNNCIKQYNVNINNFDNRRLYYH